VEIERAFRRIWPNANWAEFAPRFDGWVKGEAFTLTQGMKTRAANLGGTYFSAFRVAERIPGGARVRVANKLDLEQFIIAMRATALVSLTRAQSLSRNAIDEEHAEHYLDEGNEHALNATLGAVTRLALDGDRQTVLESIRTDRVARGYQRVTDGNACDFCQMLAERGAVYGDESASFEAHDKCGCSAEPAFD
jgi:hypothetical protein